LGWAFQQRAAQSLHRSISLWHASSLRPLPCLSVWPFTMSLALPQALGYYGRC
jgi:hypothetical protein